MAATRLSDSQKQELVARFRDGEASGSLAEAFGCSANTVSRVVRTALDPEEYEALKQQRGRSAVQVAAPAEAAKAEPSTTGFLRGHRHTMLDDSDISATRHARAFVAGALAGLVGHAEIVVSGGAEHQGPDGGGPVAVIIDRSQLV